MASLCKTLRLARHGASYTSHRLGEMRTFFSNRPLLKTRPHLQVKSDQSSSALCLAPRAFHNIAPQTGDDEPGLVTEATPAHYLVQIDSFSRLHEIEKFETGVFEAGGYKWKLKIYNDRDNAKNVPVKLALSDTSLFPENWELDAAFSICLKNQISGSYFCVIGRARFDATKTEWGGFFPKHFLTNPSYGYLKNDTCMFGAEVFVNRNDAATENMSLKNVKIPSYKGEFKIPNFPSLKESGGWVTHQTWTSDVFSAGGHEWMLKLSPNGWEQGRRLFVYLENIVDTYNVVASDDDSSDEYSDNDSLGGIMASYTLTLKSQYGDHVTTIFDSHRFSSKGDKWEFAYLDLASLNDPNKGFILNGCVHLELELSVDPPEIVDSVPSRISSWFGGLLSSVKNFQI